MPTSASTTRPNELGSFDEARVRGVRAALDRHGIHLGLHTLSAVNVAETSPYLRDAVDRYLEAYMDLARRLGAGWIVVHAGYHFTSDLERRKAAALERLKRAPEQAEKQGVQLLLENMNPEPDDAEVHYLAHDVAECRYYFDQLTSPHLGWAYTVNHAHMLPEGIAGFTPLVRPRTLRRGAPCRQPRRGRGAPAAGRGHDRLQGDVRPDRGRRLPQALHDGLRLDRRHAARPRAPRRGRGTRLTPMDDGRTRCAWAGADPLYRAYHDDEWGVPLKDDRRLYEMLVLEGFQAGLSWITILRKRDNFRRAFDNFAPEKVAAYGPEKIAALLADPGIVRNRAKIEGAILSARGWLDLMQQDGGFSGFLWQFVNGTPDRQPPAHDGRRADREPRGARDVESPQSARLQVRRPDDLLRLHAGHRHGRRPRVDCFRHGSEALRLSRLAGLRRQTARSRRIEPTAVDLRSAGAGA